MKARIDFERCSGHGRCYVLCPEVFAEDDDGYPILSPLPIAEGLADRVRRAADNCPEAAITILNEPLPPPQGNEGLARKEAKG
jgi:ferredoxin